MCLYSTFMTVPGVSKYTGLLLSITAKTAAQHNKSHTVLHGHFRSILHVCVYIDYSDPAQQVSTNRLWAKAM